MQIRRGGARRRQGSTWATRGEADLPHLCRPCKVSDLADALKERPDIVVCPGPSLEKIQSSLRGVRGIVGIIAVNRARHNLAQSIITRDFAILLDPGGRLIEHSRNVEFGGARLRTSQCN